MMYFDAVDNKGGSRRHNYYPEPYYETFSDAPVDTNEFVRPDMVCFCDIPFEPIDQFRIHSSKYGRFGVSFRRDFLVSQGANPVFYLAQSAATPLRLVGDGGEYTDFYDDPDIPSLLTKERTRGEFFNELKTRVLTAIDLFRDKNQTAVESYQRGESDVDEYKRRIFQTVDLPVALFPYVFGYTKFFDSTLPEDHADNFYMEREWRVLGTVKFDLTQVSRILCPPEYVGRVHAAMPEFSGHITPLAWNGG